MKTKLCLTALFAHTALLSFAQQPALPANPLANLNVTVRHVDDRVVLQWRESFDAGDSYATAAGKRSFHRLAGAFAVRPADANAGPALGELTKPGGVLADYESEGATKHGFVLLKAKAASGNAKTKDRVAHNQQLNALRGIL